MSYSMLVREFVAALQPYTCHFSAPWFSEARSLMRRYLFQFVVCICVDIGTKGGF